MAWCWKGKIKVMAKVKIEGDIWGLAFDMFFVS